MSDARVVEMARKMAGFLDYGPDRSRLLLQVWRQLARGRPVTGAQVDQIIAELGIAPDEAYRFLREVSEPGTGGSIVGILGLTLNESPHRLHVNGASLSAWCAGDTLFAPAALQQTVIVESVSPATGEKVRLTVSPERIEEVSPDGAAISIVIVDPQQENLASVEAIWGTFCNHIHFFPSREEAERWAAGRDDIAILAVDEGFELVRRMMAKVLSYSP